MRPNTKPVYTWCNGIPAKLDVGVMPRHHRGMVCACWNDFTEKWEFGEFTGYRWDTIHNKDAVPGAFRAYLLVMEVPV